MLKTLNRNDGEGNNEITRKEGEGLLEWVQRVDAFMEGGKMRKRAEVNARLTTCIPPSWREDTGIEMRNKLSNILPLDE